LIESIVISSETVVKDRDPLEQVPLEFSCTRGHKKSNYSIDMSQV